MATIDITEFHYDRVRNILSNNVHNVRTSVGRTVASILPLESFAVYGKNETVQYEYAYFMRDAETYTDILVYKANISGVYPVLHLHKES